MQAKLWHLSEWRWEHSGLGQVAQKCLKTCSVLNSSVWAGLPQVLLLP